MEADPESALPLKFARDLLRIYNGACCNRTIINQQQGGAMWLKVKQSYRYTNNIMPCSVSFVLYHSYSPKIGYFSLDTINKTSLHIFNPFRVTFNVPESPGNKFPHQPLRAEDLHMGLGDGRKSTHCIQEH